VTANYAIPAPVARKAVMLALGFDQEDERFQDDEQMDEIWGAMMSGAMQELEKRYQAHTVKEQL